MRAPRAIDDQRAHGREVAAPRIVNVGAAIFSLGTCERKLGRRARAEARIIPRPEAALSVHRARRLAAPLPLRHGLPPSRHWLCSILRREQRALMAHDERGQ
jgi:hypothetical protein